MLSSRVTMLRFAVPAGLLALLVPGPAHAQDLKVQSLALHQFEDGPVVEASYEYLPGETAWFSCRVTGYATEELEQDRRAHLSWQVQALDPEGLLLEEAQSGDIDERLRREDEGWVPKVAVQFLVPPFAARGTYRIPVTVTDELSGAEASAELTFRVRGEAAPEATSLGLRNFRFLAREDDRFGMQPAIYHPGDTLFASFEIVGYQMAEGNRFDVEYGLAILGPAGNVMFSQPQAQSEAKESFYPQRWVPAGFSLSLDDDIAAGSYTVAVTVRDAIGASESEVRQSFQIR